MMAGKRAEPVMRCDKFRKLRLKEVDVAQGKSAKVFQGWVTAINVAIQTQCFKCFFQKTRLTGLCRTNPRAFVSWYFSREPKI